MAAAVVLGWNPRLFPWQEEIPTVLRPGGVTVEQLRRVLSEVRVDPAVTHPMAAGRKPRRQE